MALLIDTSVLVALERGHLSWEALIQRAGDDEVAVAAITASELLHGVHRADSALRRGRRERFVEAILTRVPVLPFDLEVARVHARLWADLAAKGVGVGAHDLLISATVLAGGHRLLSRNERHFRRVDGLDLVVV